MIISLKSSVKTGNKEINCQYNFEKEIEILRSCKKDEFWKTIKLDF